MSVLTSRESLWRIALVVVSWLPLLTRAQSLNYDQAVVCGSGQGLYNWGPNQLAVDAAGNTYAAGTFNGTVLLGNTLLTAILAAPNRSFPSDNFVTKLDAAGTYVWATQMADGQSVGISNLTVDANGDVYVTGGFSSFSARFGASGIVLFNSSAQGEGFVAKLSGATGQWLWARRMGGTGFDSFGAVAVNAAGEVYAVGSCGSAVADAGPFTLTGSQGFIAKLSPNGAWLWARRTGTGNVGVSSIKIDPQGDLYLAGGFNGPSATFGTTTLTTQGVPGSPAASIGYDLFVGRVSDAGIWRWAVQGDAVTHQNLIRASALASDRAGLYIAGGYTSTSARIGGTVLPNLSAMYPTPIPAPPVPYTNNYLLDAFVARLDASTGTWSWAVRNGGADGEIVVELETDQQGRLYGRGGFSNGAGGSAELAQLDRATGAWLSFQQLHPLGLYHIALDAQNRLHLAGSFESATAQFGSLTLPQAGAGNATGFVARTGAGVLAAAGSRTIAAGLQVWPNPAGRGGVRVAGPAVGQAVQVLDGLGRAVVRATMPATGPLLLGLPEGLAPGLYLVRGGGQVRQLVVE